MSTISISRQDKPLLIVDDNDADRELFIQQIKKGLAASDDLEIIEANSCEAAIELLNTVAPCCCLVDYRLPGKNGLDLLKWIRKTEEGKDVPVIAMTGDGDEKIAVELMRNGALDYLVKSDFTTELLVRSINNAIHTSSLQGKIRYLAHYDSLTGLLNRALLMDHLQTSIDRCDRYEQSCSLLYIDVDNFKQVNDNYGHEAGDILLKTVSSRILKHCRSTDSAARLGGDEFAILLEQIDRKNTGITAEKILRAVSEPVLLDGIPFEISLSIGIAHYPHTASNARELIRQADEAMYRAKHAGKGKYTQFTLKQKRAWERQHRLEAALPKAIENGELALAYQPIVTTSDHALSSFNVSVRWLFEDAVVPAMDIIELVSRLGLSDSFHVWLIDTAFKQLHCWQQQSDNLQVNLSVLAHQCQDKLLASCLRNAFDNYKINASRLQLQLAEKTLLMHPAATTKMINTLHEQGAQVAINDFGSDYSSIAHLSSLPLDTLCIDKQFFEDIHGDKRKRLFTEALIAMASTLGLSTIAKGIELKQQAAIVGTMGCDYMQGYYFGYPQLYTQKWQEFMQHFPLLQSADGQIKKIG